VGGASCEYSDDWTVLSSGTWHSENQIRFSKNISPPSSGSRNLRKIQARQQVESCRDGGDMLL
jgi:hypothetical protein